MLLSTSFKEKYIYLSNALTVTRLLVTLNNTKNVLHGNINLQSV